MGLGARCTCGSGDAALNSLAFLVGIVVVVALVSTRLLLWGLCLRPSDRDFSYVPFLRQQHFIFLILCMPRRPTDARRPLHTQSRQD